ncbi:MAG: hypothetical protein V4722_18205 [Bacteroidota bacterium]
MANFNVGGFTITQDPPNPTGINGFSDDTLPVSLGASTVEVVPLQTLDLSVPAPDASGTLRLASGNQPVFTAGPNTFIVQPGESLAFTFDLAASVPLVPLTFGIVVAVETTDTLEAKFRLTVNGHDQDAVEEKGSPYDGYHPVTWQIASNILKTGLNTFSVGNSNHSDNDIWINAASIQGATGQTIQGYYYWKSVFNCTANQGDTVTDSVAVTNGKSTSDSSTYSFAETIGLSVEGEAEVPLLASVSYTVNTSFTATQSYTHTVSITESETDTVTLGISNPATEMTVQFWQLCLRFESNGQYIEQLIGVGQVPGVIETRYPADATGDVVINASA